MAGRRGDGPRIGGILVVAKPAGLTSHDVIDLVRRLTGVRRVGHGGTLDPFAMGVLPVFIGHATRMVDYHRADEKAYRATVVFGAHSTTDDLDGVLTPGEGAAPDREQVEAALGAFRGTIQQVPPDHSAVHVGGRRAYELARGGEKPRLAPRTVTIAQLEQAAWDAGDPERPVAVLEVRCTAGTYVRALARDLGHRLGCGAYLGALTRTASGPFRLEDAHPLDLVRQRLAAGDAASLLLAPDAGLEHLPVLQVSRQDQQAIAHGGVVRAALHSAETVRVLDEDGMLVAMAHIEEGRLYPDKVFISPEVPA